MNHDALLTLLRDADRSAGGVPDIGAGLADRVRGRRRRERIARTTAVGGVAAALLLATVTWTLWPAGRSSTEHRIADATSPLPALTAEEISRLRTEVASLRAQAEASTLAVETLRRVNRSRARMSELRTVRRSIDPAIAADCELERAAITIVQQADRMQREHGLTDGAREAYERVVRLFPETQAAAAAREKLVELKRKQGDLL
jgi:hypothetical protein